MLIVPEIEKNTPSDTIRMKSYLTKTIGYEMKNIINPCYIPKIVKHWKDLEYLTNISQKDIKIFKNSIGTTYKDFNIISDAKTLLILIILINYCRLGLKEHAQLLFLFLTIKFYSSLMHRFLGNYCVEAYWDTALQNLSPKHLFKVKNGISNALVYLSAEELDKYYYKLSQDDLTDKDLVLMTYAIRTRIAQSVRSFVSAVHDAKNSASSTGVSTGEEQLNNIALLAEKISMSICTYNQVDIIAFNEAVIKSGIKKDVAKSIVDNISDVEYKDSIKFIVVLMDRLLTLKNVCVSSKQILLVRKIVNGNKVNNYVVKDEILKLLYTLENGTYLKTLNANQLLVFTAHYLTLYIRNRACGKL